MMKLLIDMPAFPVLTPIQRARRDGRIGQRDILPTATRRRHQVAQEREFTAVVAPLGGIGDFTNIKQAVDFVNDLGGGTVFIKRGTYVPSSKITLFTNIHLLGEDQSNTIIDFNNQGNYLDVVGAAGASNNKKNVTIQGLTLKNTTNTTGSVDVAIADNFRIKDVTIDSSEPASGTGGIQIGSGGTKAYIENCRFTNILKAIDVQGTPNEIYITDNSFNATIGSAITLQGGTSIRVTGNSILDSTGAFAAINTTSTITDLIVSGNSIRNSNDDGIAIINQVGGVVIGNYLEGDAASDYGIIVGSDDVVISSNFIDGYDNDGINLFTADNNVVSANRCLNCGGYGINISDAPSDKNIVTGNQLLGNTTGALNDSGTSTETQHNVTA